MKNSLRPGALPLLCALLIAPALAQTPDPLQPRDLKPGERPTLLDPNAVRAIPAKPADKPEPATPPAEPLKNYPIIFLPGVAGSFLNRTSGNSSQRVWMDGGLLANSNLPFPTIEYLRMSAGGTPEHTIVPDAIMMRKEVLPGQGLSGSENTVYAGFIEFLKGKGYREDVDLFPFPYDFRLLPDDPKTMQRLDLVVNRAKRATRADKVILIGHSMGGLVARSYIVRERGRNVRALLGVGTPWLGAPVAFKALGPEQWDFEMAGLNKGVVQKLVTNWPGVYTLIPNTQYFDAYSSGFFFQESETKPIQTEAQQLAQARSFNPGLYADAVAWRRKILNGQSHGVENFVVVNSARNTITRYKQKHEKNFLGFESITFPTPNFGLGDDTVPLKSGVLNNQPLIGPTQAFIVDGAGFGHSRLTEFRAVQNKIWSIVDGVNQAPRTP